jgi:hypothetical protein
VDDEAAAEADGTFVAADGAAADRAGGRALVDEHPRHATAPVVRLRKARIQIAGEE